MNGRRSGSSAISQSAPWRRRRNAARERRTLGEPEEVGGPAGPEPTRYGDWERKGIAVDF